MFYHSIIQRHFRSPSILLGLMGDISDSAAASSASLVHKSAQVRLQLKPAAGGKKGSRHQNHPVFWWGFLTVLQPGEPWCSPEPCRCSQIGVDANAATLIALLGPAKIHSSACVHRLVYCWDMTSSVSLVPKKDAEDKIHHRNSFCKE